MFGAGLNLDDKSRIILEIDICGRPASGGSKTTGQKKDGTRFVRPASKFTKPWMERVAEHARAEYQDSPVTCSVGFSMVFRIARPANHFGTGKNKSVLKGTAPLRHRQDPDTTKLVRSTEDALSRIVWKDDNQVDAQRTGKRWTLYGESPGVHIIIWNNDEIEQGVFPGFAGR